MKKIILLIFVLVLLFGCNKRVNNELKNQIESCPDCVYSYYEEGIKYGEKGSILKDYVYDYTKLKDQDGNQRRFFLGHVLDKNGKVKKGYACGIENNIAFCLEGTNDGSKYGTNVEVLKEVYGEDKCNTLDNYIVCRGSIVSGSNKNGTSDIGTSDGVSCMAINNNSLVCE